ncbi:MAG TPA: phage holin family protein [Polyangiaceae bacterium]|nr:phage holin family protein [Polyangiaceae bacterium]
MPTPTTGTPPTIDTPPLTELVEHLSRDLQQLAKDEAALAKHELVKGLNAAKQDAIALALGAAALAGGAMALLLAAILALALVVPVWLAALLVGAVTSGAGALLLLNGKAKLARLHLKPEHALESLRRDAEAIKRAAT